jgi:flavin reductase (DIM6/NTAB) family NADH-FMN oxidoreductase RutF
VTNPNSQDTGGIDAAHFRNVLGHFPTGVTVITAMHEASPIGMAIGSFASVSLDPPLVLFCPQKTSSSWPHIEASGAFCANILSSEQEDLCRVMASKAADKFEGVGWRKAESGSPVLADVLGWIDCTIEGVHDEGDHFVVIGRVLELDAANSGLPLIFYRGGYGGFAP